MTHLKRVSETVLKLEHVPGRLVDEFPDVPRDEVMRTVGRVSHALLRVARFTDFVPLLTHRYVRERVLDAGYRRPSRAA